VTDLKKIAIHYLKTWFILDFLTSVPLDTLVTLITGGDSSYLLRIALRALRLAKLLRLVRFLRFMESKEASLYFTPSVLRLLNTMFLLFWIWHVIACGYWYIATKEGLGFTQWTPDPSHYMNPQSLNYLLSVQWTLQTTFSFGAPALPETYIEAWFTIVSVLLGISMNAYVIGSAGSALTSMDAEKIQRRNQLDRIITYMKRRKLPSYFQRIILDWYEYFGDKSSQDDVVADLPLSLRQRMSLLLNREVVKTVPSLRDLDLDTILSIMQSLRSQTYMPGEHVYKQDDIGEYLYFVKYGQFNLYLGEQSTSVMSLLRGDMFGQDALVDPDNPRHQANVRANKYSEVLFLDVDTYIELAMDSKKLRQLVEREAKRESDVCARSKANFNKYGKINKLNAAAKGDNFGNRNNMGNQQRNTAMRVLQTLFSPKR
jgi:hyperpolarization activated cyclic nucleotide-gated potassium channel 2